MRAEDLIIQEEDQRQLEAALTRLREESQARCLLLIDRRDGTLFAKHGFTEGLDLPSLAALAAGAFASTREIARLVGEPEFSTLFHEGQQDHLYICLVGEHGLLMILFDDRTPAGLVRLCAREYSQWLARILNRCALRAQAPVSPTPWRVE